MSGIDRFNNTKTFNLHVEDNLEQPKKQYPKLCVCLDPGHAESTPGKRSPFSLGKVKTPELDFHEYKFNRVMAEKIKSMLEEYGVEVFITTTDEKDGTSDAGLITRAQRANKQIILSGKKGVFVSIHSDADGMGDKWTKAHGWSCFTTKGQNNSDKLADCLYEAAEKILSPMEISIRTDKKDGDKDWEENFTVLVNASMPAVLTENLFYTNIDDLTFLMSEVGLDAIANVHVAGILKFAESFYGM